MYDCVTTALIHHLDVPALCEVKWCMYDSAAQVTNTQDILTHCDRWVTERAYAEIHSLARGTLTNWRFLDRRAGRTEALPGYPRYRYFSTSVRYWLPLETA